MSEFHTTYRSMVALALLIRSALRCKGLRYLARRAWSKIGLKLGWSNAGLGRELGRTYTYQDWVKDHPTWALDLAAQRRWARTGAGLPSFTLMIRTAVDSQRNLARSLKSLRRQTYPHWSMVLLEDGTQAAASASSASERGSDFVGFMRAGDTLSPEALYEFARAIVDRDPRPDVLYCDEDHLAADGRTRCRPIFKPSWSPEMLLGYHYTGRLTLARSSLVDEVGGLDRSLGEAAEWDLMLRLSERTSEVVRVAHCLYHNGEHTVALHADSGNLQRKDILESHLRRTGRHEAKAVQQPNRTFRVIWPLLKHPKVSVIIPTRNSPLLIRQCIEGLLHKTVYPTKEIILVDNGSTDPDTLALYQEWSSSSAVSILPYDQPFNYSTACNLGASAARGDYLLFLNNDIEVIHPGWLEELVRWAQLPGIGVVGTKLIYPNVTIQHAGVALGRRDIHIFMKAHDDSETAPTNVVFGTPNIYRNVTMLTGACQLLTRSLFDEIGGYDKRCLLVASDTILCLEAFRLGYRSVYTPYAALVHHESATRGFTDESDDQLLFAQRLDQLNLREDPFFHPELHPLAVAPGLRPIWAPTPRDALGKYIEELMAALPREHASIHYDRSSLQAFLGGLTHHPIGAHWSEQRVGRDLKAATWFVIDLLRQDEGLSQKYPRALGDGVDGDFCRWLCLEGIGRYRLPSGASQTIRAAFASQPGLPVRRLIEDRGMGNPSFRVARIPSLLTGLLSWLVEHGKDHAIADRQIWWFLLESVEDPVRELVRVYDTNPVWQRHFPDPLSPLGWKRLTHWMRDRYGFDATGYDFQAYSPSRPFE